MTMSGPKLACAAFLLTLYSSVPAAAQVFGTFNWQMQPYCNRVTLTLTTTAPGFALHGSDDQCGAATKGSIVGVGVFNPDGSVGLNFTIVASPGGLGTHVSAIVNPANGQGTWSDHAGNSGTFAFFAAAPGLPARPAATDPVNVADNPNQASDPCAFPLPQTLQLCGTSAARWINGGYTVPGIQVWRDAQGYVHIRGAATRSVGPPQDVLLVLPAALRPTRPLTFQVMTSGPGGIAPSGSAMLFVFARDHPSVPGNVQVLNASNLSHPVIHLGEISFRVDR